MKIELITFPLLPSQPLQLPSGSEVLELVVEDDISKLKVAITEKTARKDGAKMLLPNPLTGTLQSVPATAWDHYEIRTLMEAEQGKVTKWRNKDGSQRERDLHAEFMTALTECETNENARLLGRFETVENPAAWRVYLVRKEKP